MFTPHVIKSKTSLTFVAVTSLNPPFYLTEFLGVAIIFSSQENAEKLLVDLHHLGDLEIVPILLGKPIK